MAKDRLTVLPAPAPSRRRGFTRTIMLVAVVSLTLVGVGIAALSLSSASAGANTSTDLHQVLQQSFDIEVIASGELEALNQTEIRCELENPTSIVELTPEGTRVKAGDVLVRLNAESIKTSIEDELLKVETARSDLIAAENAYEIQVNENDADVRRFTLKLDLAQIELRKWEEGDLVKKQEDLRLAIDQAQRRLVQRQERYEQSQKLFERGFLASDQLKNDEIAYIDAQASLKTAQSNKWVYDTFELEKRRKQLTSDVGEAEAELERVKRQNISRLASKEADRTNRQRQLQIREERLSKLESQLEHATVVAPTDGLVVYGSTAQRARRGWDQEGPLQIGRTVRPNELLVVLPDTSQMIASVRVHEANAGRVRPGQSATVRIDAIRDRAFTGTITEIGVLAESGGWRDPNLREYTVKILLDEAEGTDKLKPSMRVEGEIIIDSVEDVVAVPAQAVFREGRSSFVYTPAGAKYERTPVKIGRRSVQYAEVVTGVAPGQSVLLREPGPGEVLAGESDEADDAPAPRPQHASAG